jgi:hypothetical protein
MRGVSFADRSLIGGEYQVALPLPCPGSEFVGWNAGRIADSRQDRVIGINNRSRAGPCVKSVSAGCA